MTTNEILLIISSIVLPLLSGLGSYFMSVKKSKEDVTQLREQSKLDIERLMNQHKLDLEALDRKHQLEVEKLEIDHKHKLDLLQKEMETKLGGDLMGGMLTTVLSSPQVKSEMSKSLLQSLKKKKK